MTKLGYTKLIVPLTLGGVLFSGYLSAVRYFSNSCAFDEPCPMFLGYPACYFGLAMFLSLFIVSLTALVRRIQSDGPIKINILVSGAGTLFAGYFASEELLAGYQQGFATYGLGVSTCIYGAVFFIACLLLSLFALSRAHSRE